MKLISVRIKIHDGLIKMKMQESKNVQYDLKKLQEKCDYVICGFIVYNFFF